MSGMDLIFDIELKNESWIIKDVNTNYEISLDKRIFNFVIRVIKYLKTIEKSVINNVISYQLAKCSSSMGANYEEAQGASSRKDFLHKVAISHREAKETNYWLRVVKGAEIDDSKELDYLINESRELKKILGSIVGKVRKSRKGEVGSEK